MAVNATKTIFDHSFFDSKSVESRFIPLTAVVAGVALIAVGILLASFSLFSPAGFMALGSCLIVLGAASFYCSFLQGPPVVLKRD